MSEIFKALSDPTRRKILELLRAGPMRAGDVADNFEVSKATLSAHLAVLRQAGLVSSERQGKSIIYSLRMSVLEDGLLSFAKTFGLHVSESPEEGSTDEFEVKS